VYIRNAFQIEQADEGQRRAELDDEIADGKGRGARPAFAAQQPVTQKRQIIE